MNRVLVTGGAGMIGTAVVRRLLGDPSFEVRVSDRRPAPQWMREGCEIHRGDLRVPDEAIGATRGCSHVIHLAAAGHGRPYTLTEDGNALSSGVVRAALDVGVERFVQVSSAAVLERATTFPTTEAQLRDVAVPRDAHAFSKLTGEVYVRAAHDEHGFPYTICRPCDVFGPGAAPGLIAACLALPEGAPLPVRGDGARTRTPTHVDDVAAGIVAALASPAGLREDFNLAAGEERTVAEIARVVWAACGRDPDAFALEPLPAAPGEVARRWPDVTKARELLGWEARIGLREGVVRTVAWLREHAPAG